MADGRLSIVGLHGGTWFGDAAGRAVAGADVVVGSARHLDSMDVGGRAAPYRTVAELLGLVEGHLDREAQVCVLTSGDPGFFGAGRILAARFGAAVTAVHPAPSSVALAFARVGMPWDDAVVVSAHGRDLDDGLPAVRAAAKAAVLTSPVCPPEAVGRALTGIGSTGTGGPTAVWVASHLGDPGEVVTRTDLTGLAAGTWDPLSVVLLVTGVAPPAQAAVSWKSQGRGGAAGWGRPVDSFEHRAGMITKPEVRAVVLGKLALHPGATLWDVGAGSGSVAVEACRAAPGLRSWAVERRPDDCGHIRVNAAGLPVTVVEGEAPAALAGLPPADRAFVGGGGLLVLDAVRSRVGPDGVVVATFTAIDRATEAAGRLGNLVQIAVNRAVPIGPEGTLRLEADNPVFIAWGPGTSR